MGSRGSNTVESPLFDQSEKDAVQMPHANFVSRLLYLPRGISRLEKLGQRKVYPKNYMLVQAGIRPSYCYIVIL